MYGRCSTLNGYHWLMLCQTHHSLHCCQPFFNTFYDRWSWHPSHQLQLSPASWYLPGSYQVLVALWPQGWGHWDIHASSLAIFSMHDCALHTVWISKIFHYPWQNFCWKKKISIFLSMLLSICGRCLRFKKWKGNPPPINQPNSSLKQNCATLLLHCWYQHVFGGNKQIITKKLLKSKAPGLTSW